MQLSSAVTAIVTGGASGLGETTARLLASKGVRVALFDLNESLGNILAEEIGGIFVQVDVTSDESVDLGFSKVRGALGQERILINCAGIGNAIKTASVDKKTGEIRYFPSAEFDRVIQVNLVGTFRCIARSAAGMLTLVTLGEADRGVIINTSSIAAEDGQVGQAAYAASKAAIVGMTLPIARDLMNDGIRVNTILPGLFDTPLLARAPENIRVALGASVPYPKRLGRPQEFAQLALSIIENGYFNGEDIRLDGGIRMAPR